MADTEFYYLKDIYQNQKCHLNTKLAVLLIAPFLVTSSGEDPLVS